MTRKKKRKRRHYTPEQKAALLQRHLVDKVPVSEICNEEKLQPSVFYGWLKTLMANAPTALASPRGSSSEKRLQQKVDALQEKIQKKDGVIAEVTEEFVRLKKELGEL
ncbi:MAG: transposase [Gemmatimonadales bacterium]|jgi:transposase-like protein|nr:transposase [Gemmatimonadales bacterium]MBT7126399.1 transposase [Gemmatimonadales bacterium]MBT7693418.1 transposase [Gemmatimonadales bacterium]